jgi:DNA-binding NarL/FixJ family response regulator
MAYAPRIHRNVTQIQSVTPALPVLHSVYAALWIGDATLPEFAPAAETLRRRLRLVVAATADDALRGVAGEFDVMILAEAVPGGPAATTTDRLRRRYCGVPIVRLVGPLCDGELRSSPPETLHRVRWLDAVTQFARDCDALAVGRCPTWGLPVTRSAEEAVLDAATDLPAKPGSAAAATLRVGIDAPHPAAAAWLRDAVQACGAQVVDIDAVAPDVVLRQVAEREAAEIAVLADLRRRFPQARLIALGGFLRRETVEQFTAAGADAVVALPAAASELARRIAGT